MTTLTRNMPGHVDENGVLWHNASVGKFVSIAPGMETLWSCIKGAAEKHATRNAVGERAVVHRQMVNGMEKVVMGTYSYTTYAQYMTRINNLGSGLATLPELSKGSTVIIYADTQLLWMLSAFAAWRQGLIVGTIYATLGEDGAEFGINQSGCSMIFADGKLLKILGKIATKIPKCKRVVVFKPEDMDGDSVAKLKAAEIEVTPLPGLEAAGAEKPAKETPSSAEETAVLMYTSGTTGNPKGVLITHANIASLVAATHSPTSALGSYITPGYRYLAYLPLAHIMELAVEVALFSAGFTIGYGGTGTVTPKSAKMLQPEEYAGAKNQLGDAAALQPDIFVAAPAVLDKVLIGVKKIFSELTGLKKAAVDDGLASGFAKFDSGDPSGGPSAACGLKPLITKIAFGKVKKLLGGKVKVFITGSAPLGVEVQKFVQTVFGCPVRQGFGLTETCAGTCITLPSDNSPSTVGPPQECACIKLRDWDEGNYRNADLDDKDIGMRRGEVLIGGPMVCTGYLENPDMPDKEVSAKNKEEFIVIDGIRYFCTGDIGQFTPQGNLQIIDRKKDLVKLQQGEYVALSKVENALKSSKFTMLPMCYAKSTMSYSIALICPVEAALRAVPGAEGRSLKDLCVDPTVIKAVEADVQAICKAAKLASFEIPKKVILIDELWTPENEMLTAVNKLKRKPIEAKHQAQIEAVYI